MAGRLLLLALCAALTAQTQTPVFRTGVDLVQLDVSVLDKNRQPVRSLTQADFTVFEDGKPQSIEAFAPVDQPDLVRSTTKWMDQVSPDVTTNQIDNHRIFALVLDDALMPADPWAVEATRKSALSFIDRMGPGDLAAVIFTKDNRGAQDLTNDRVKLRRAVESLSRLGNVPTEAQLMHRPNLGIQRSDPGDPKPDPSDPPCWYYVASMQVVERAAGYLATLPQRRKALLYMSGGMSVDIGQQRVMGPLFPPTTNSRRECGVQVVGVMRDAFRSAQRGNVNIYGMDPMGLRADAEARLGGRTGVIIEFLQTVSDNTGGHAIFNTNDFEPGLTQIFRENSFYYLLGYQPTNVKADGTFRRLEVKVNRPGVEVRNRKNYVAPAPPNAKAPPPPGVAAIAEIVPKTDLPLRIAIAPFATTGEAGASAAVVLGLQRPAQAERAVEEIKLHVSAFSPEGDPRGSSDAEIMLNIPPARRGDDVSRYDLLARLSLKPGRYRIRASAESTTLDKIGSVFADVDVPDFAKEPLSLSGVAISVLPGQPVAPPDALAGVIPVVPTTAREFARHERVTVFLRVYQGATTTIAPVTLVTRITDAVDKPVLDRSETVGPDRFSEARAADVRFVLPVQQLTPGDYLLTFEVSGDKRTVKRDVPFKVK